MTIKKILQLLIILPAVCVATLASATTSVSITANLYTKDMDSCTVNNNQPIIVDFGDSILSSQIAEGDFTNGTYSAVTDGANYQQVKKISIKCSSPNNIIFMTMTGDRYYNSIMTNRPDIRIAYYIDQSTVSNGFIASVGDSDYLFINDPSGITFDFKFTPVKDYGSYVPGGSFYAAVTLVVNTM